MEFNCFNLVWLVRIYIHCIPFHFIPFRSLRCTHSFNVWLVFFPTLAHSRLQSDYIVFAKWSRHLEWVYLVDACLQFARYEWRSCKMRTSIFSIQFNFGGNLCVRATSENSVTIFYSCWMFNPPRANDKSFCNQFSQTICLFVCGWAKNADSIHVTRDSRIGRVLLLTNMQQMCKIPFGNWTLYIF